MNNHLDRKPTLQLSKEMNSFIENVKWTYAKSMPKWPHEYIVRKKVNPAAFDALAEFIDTFGYEESFYFQKQTYYEFGQHTYWHMGNIINRCLIEDTYAKRRDRNNLPK